MSFVEHVLNQARPDSINENKPFDVYGPGEIVAWSRILDGEELLYVLNSHGTEPRGADVIIDSNLNREGRSVMMVVLNTAQTAAAEDFKRPHPEGLSARVNKTTNGRAFIRIHSLSPAEVDVLAKHP